MKRQRVSVDEERTMLLGMILSSEFLKEIRVILDVGLLKNPYSRTIADWCTEYYEKYEQCPGMEIQTVFDGQRSRLSTEDAEYIEKFLTTLPALKDKFEGMNAKYRVDVAELYLKRRKLEMLVDQVWSDLEVEDVAKAENRIAQFERVSRPKGAGVDLLEEPERVAQAIMMQDETLMGNVGGVLGGMLGNFYRGDLIAVAGPPKRGKTWWLFFFAVNGLFENLRVLVVSLEMLEHQVVRRLVQIFSGCALKDKEVQVPKFVFSDKEGGYVVKHDRRELKRISIVAWKESVVTFKRHNTASRFRLLTFPQDTMNVEDLEIHLENLEYYDGFVPDVIIVDYADIMGAERDSPRDYRNRLDHTWKRLRSLAQKRGCLVFTGTQTDRSTLMRDASASNVSEDMRKLAHVGKMIGLNQTTREREVGLMRVALWMERHDRTLEADEVVVTQCLDLGRPCLDSILKKDLRGEFNDRKSKRAT